MSKSSARGERANPYIQIETHCGPGDFREVRDPNFDLVANNLARFRWYGPTPSRGEERDLIRRAQAGDEQAKERLHQLYGRTVLKIAGKFYGTTRDNLASAGFAGLQVAIDRFDLSRSNGLRAYAEPWIRKFINAEIRRPRETRADRVLHSHLGIGAAELAARARCSLSKAEEALAVYKAAKHQEHYSTTGSADDGDGTKERDHGSDKPNQHQNPTTAARHPMLAMYDCFDPHKQNPQLLHHEILGPASNLLTRKYAGGLRVRKPGMVDVAAEAAECLAEYSLKEYHRPCFAGHAGLVGKADRKKISRRDYAELLAEHDRKHKKLPVDFEGERTQVERDLIRARDYADEKLGLHRYPDSEERAAEGESPKVQAHSRNQMMLVGRFGKHSWDWAKPEKRRPRNWRLPPARPHHKPKIRHSIIRGRQITVEEKRHVRR